MLEGVIKRNIGDRAEWLEWREANVNASEAACLWGDEIHPYLSAFKLWALKSGKIEGDGDNPAMKRGRLLEPVAIQLLSEQKPTWIIDRPPVYLHHPGWRIGCTPDAYAWDGERRGVVQIKTAGKWAFEKYWRDPDTKEVIVPLWIAVQATVECLLSGCDWAVVGLMVISDGGLIDMHVLDIPVRPGILTNLQGHVREFWRRVDAGEPYPIDHFKDADTILQLYREDDGSEIDLSDDPEVDEWLIAREVFKSTERLGAGAEKQRKAIDLRLIERMGNARLATFKGQLIKAATIHKKAFSVEATSYRQVRVKDL
jgi:hypothetical protein